MAQMQSFAPGYGTGVAVTAGAASVTAALVGSSSTALCLTNSGTDTAYIRTGKGSSMEAATAADYPVLGGQQVSITIGVTHTHFAYIAPSGAPTLHVMRGEGI